MFAREGFTSLASLWALFEERFYKLCLARSIDNHLSEPRLSNGIFGTALDLCEDAFLKSFDNMVLELVLAKGEIVSVQSTLVHSNAKLLGKLSVQESHFAYVSPDDPGSDIDWFVQMGSRRFNSAEPFWIWPQKGIRGDRGEIEKYLAVLEYNTLPMLFERPAFVIAREPAPWTFDLLEDNFRQALSVPMRGASICLSDPEANKWRKKLSRDLVSKLLGELLCNEGFGDDQETSKRGGRPAKVGTVAEVYRELGLDRSYRTWKDKLSLVEARLDFTVSMRTLRRAASLGKPPEDDQ